MADDQGPGPDLEDWLEKASQAQCDWVFQLISLEGTPVTRRCTLPAVTTGQETASVRYCKIHHDLINFWLSTGGKDR